MAYLEPGKLTCPRCGFTGKVIRIIGVGPQTKPGEGPAYVRLKDSGPFLQLPEGAGKLLCPDCGTEVGADK